MAFINYSENTNTLLKLINDFKSMDFKKLDG